MLYSKRHTSATVDMIELTFWNLDSEVTLSSDENMDQTP